MTTFLSRKLRKLVLTMQSLLGEDSRSGNILRRHRLIFYFLMCGGISFVSFYLAFFIRFELNNVGAENYDWMVWFSRSVAVVVLLRVSMFLLLGLHRATWHYAGIRDAMQIFFAVALGSGAIAVTLMVAWSGHFPRSILAIEAIVCFLLHSGFRFSLRILEEFLAGWDGNKRTRVVIVGAGAAGNLTVRAMLTRGLRDYLPVAMVDDDPLKQGTTIQGVPVYGPVEQVGKIAARTGAEALVLALPTANSSEFYRVVRFCKDTELPLKTTPDMAQILRSSNVVTRVSDFCLEDLLHRRPIRTDIPEIQQFLFGRSILVTGAAGSIGSELCRQIAEQGTHVLVCVDKDENGLFRLEHELKKISGETQLVFFLGDVKDEGRMAEVFETWQPQVVFHAAAYKHVPILQHHPVEAIRNNVGGTRNIADLAHEFGVEQFVLISTDKAVNPTSVMGATKRIAERVVRSRNQRSQTGYSIIRFGNVLGSAGSVVELFMKQIRSGWPVTVTHPDIERFFMTIPEAVHLVLFSATMGQGGETFILDMGKPVKIVQLARQIITLSGLTPEVDVPIEYTGLRPGEKLFEELWTDKELPQVTSHPGIRKAPGKEPLPDSLLRDVDGLLQVAWDNDVPQCWSRLLELVPSFKGQTQKMAHLPPDQTAVS
ncbi:MAG: polysaccharide biosynthesis protein [Gemmatimonadales bacterium]|nr:polysaccharide biosynthesis protein [Gemmatimonadales bacterium]